MNEKNFIPMEVTSAAWLPAALVGTDKVHVARVVLELGAVEQDIFVQFEGEKPENLHTALHFPNEDTKVRALHQCVHDCAQDLLNAKGVDRSTGYGALIDKLALDTMPNVVLYGNDDAGTHVFTPASPEHIALFVRQRFELTTARL